MKLLQRLTGLVLLVGIIAAGFWIQQRPTPTPANIAETSWDEKALALLSESRGELVTAQAETQANDVKRAEELKAARHADQLLALRLKTEARPRWQTIREAVSIGVYAGLFVVSLTLAFGYYHKLSVYYLELRGARIPIKRRDLSQALPIARDLALAEKMEQQAPEKAFALYKSMTELRIQELRALVGRRGMSTPEMSSAMPALPEAMPQDIAPTAPTFADARAAFRPGEILTGYQHGKPVYMPVKGFVSCALGGESGSGKTAKLCFLLSQLAWNGIDLSILDAHQGAPDSLTEALGSVAHLPNVRVFDAFELREAVQTMLSEVQAAIDSRTPAQPPRVFVLDELRPLNRACADVETLMDKLANEGRKYRFYGIFASQTWEAKMFQQAGSAARDACVLKAAARMPKAQARLLLQDSDAARQVAKLSTPEMYLASAQFSGVLQVPFAGPADMDLIAQEFFAPEEVKQVVNAPANLPPANAPQATGRNEIDKPIKDTGKGNDSTEVQIDNIMAIDNELTEIDKPVDSTKPGEPGEIDKPVDVLRSVRELLENGTLQKDIASAAQIDNGLLSRVLKGERPLTENVKRRLTEYLTCQTLSNTCQTPEQQPTRPSNVVPLFREVKP